MTKKLLQISNKKEKIILNSEEYNLLCSLLFRFFFTFNTT